jgi:hypothetical protein
VPENLSSIISWWRLFAPRSCFPKAVDKRRHPAPLHRLKADSTPVFFPHELRHLLAEPSVNRTDLFQIIDNSEKTNPTSAAGRDDFPSFRHAVQLLLVRPTDFELKAAYQRTHRFYRGAIDLLRFHYFLNPGLEFGYVTPPDPDATG